VLLPYNHLQSFHMFRLELLITSTNTLSLTLSPFNNLYMYNISSVTFEIDIVYSNLVQGLECLFRMFHFYRVDLPSIVTNETNLAVSTMQAASRDATWLHTPWWSLVSLSSTWHLPNPR
jgi:hypothetical protein